MERIEKIKELFREKLDASYLAYMASLQGMDSSALIERVEEIATARLVYRELKDGGYNADYLEYLLRFQNPLEVVRDQWRKERGSVLDGDMEHVLWTLADRKDAEQDYELDEAFLVPGQEQGVRMC
jgi:hypothetical protein